MKDDSLLNAGEHEVLRGLVIAWNAFVKLEKLHPDEQDEFRATIHSAQKQIMARPVQREFNKEIYGNKGDVK